jgi:hypothetical protein
MLFGKPYGKRQRYELLRGQLDLERSSWMPHWRDLANFILPRRPRFVVSDANRGNVRNRNIIDSTATRSLRTLESGMMAGMTSPARPWRKLSTPDPALAKYGPVKDWLYDVNEILEALFHRSHLYNILPSVYGDTAVFATGAVLMEEDFETVLKFTSVPVGSFMVAHNVFFRELRLTVRQLVERFGQVDGGGDPDWSNFSDNVRHLFDNGLMETWVDVCHLIEPNPDYDENKLGARFKRFSSVYYEKGTAGNTALGYQSSIENKFLRESGYDYFPVLIPRWRVTGEDFYGTDSPGIIALEDIKQLQLGERKLMQAVEKMINPPMVGPPELRNMKASILPADITYVNSRDAGRGFQPAHEIDPRIQEMEAKQEQIRGRIKNAFYEDLLLMMAESDRREMTAREVVERHEEKMWAFGSVLEQFNKDLFSPLVDAAFYLANRQGLIPDPPEELEGVELKVEYVSIMAQAQKMIGMSAVERTVGFITQVAAVDPSAMDKLDIDETIDRLADMTGVPPQMIRPTEEAVALREQRAQKQQAADMAAGMGTLAKGAKDLSGANLEEDNVLKRLLDQARAGSAGPVAA